MRFVWAVVAFVLATLLIGAGIAQRTVFLGPADMESELEVAAPAPYVLIDGAVLRTNPGQQKLTIRGDGPLFAAVGRTADLTAWLADVDYNDVTVTEEGEPIAVQVSPAPSPTPTATPGEGEPPAEGEAPAEGEQPAEEPADDTVRPGPEGSDLWLEEYTGQGVLFVSSLQLPEGMSLLVAADGVADAPSDLVVSWPLDRSTPWAGPLIAAGIVVLLAGLVLYVLGIRHQRRGRGPRRKGLGPLPPTAPIDLAEIRAQEQSARTDDPATDAPAGDPAEGDVEKGSAEAGKGAGDRAERTAVRPVRPRRRLLALPALGLTVMLASGCTAESWPQFGEPTATPSPTPTVVMPEGQQAPAVTAAQAERILGSLAATVAEADAALDIDLAATRLSGSALEARRTDYALRGAIADRAAPTAIPTQDIRILLPQAMDGWPRTVLVLSEDTSDETVPPVIFTMTQDDPWSLYRITYLSEMRASAQLPDLAPAWLGTALIPPDSPFLEVTPANVVVAFADVVDAGEESVYYRRFDEASLELATSIRDSRQTVAQNLIDNGAAETSAAAFDIEPSSFVPVALSSLDSGAIVAVSLIDTETVTPTTEDAVIRFGDNPEATALTGVSESATGVVTTYSMQLFFSVPSRGSTDPIRLLAVDQDLLGVTLP